jgi:hypothetical protein
MTRKLRAILCHQSQVQLFRDDRAVQRLDQYRGVRDAGSAYVEAFVYVASSTPQ